MTRLRDKGLAMYMQYRVVFLILFTGGTMFAGELTVEGDPRIVIRGEGLETLWEEGGFTEGAAAGPDGNMYFSDFAQPFDSGPARVMKFNTKTNAISVYCPDSGMGNGLMFTRDGRLLGCCASPLEGHRALVQFMEDGSVNILADQYDGKKLNSPNDLVIDRNGIVYFTDPKYVGPEECELDSFDVYRFDHRGLSIATKEIDKPNGLIFAPDQKTIYVAETDNGSDKADIETDFERGRMTLNSFRVNRRGEFYRKKVLVNFGDELGIDGMTVDQAGNIYAAVRSARRFGIVVFTPRGKEIAFIETPELPTNVSFGRGAESSRLYITAGSGFYRIRTKAIGYHPAVDH